MEYRQLGRTGLRVSALGLGGAAFGNVYGDLAAGEAGRLVQTALDLGINFLDVAPYYGVTRAETVLGQALRPVPRDRYYLCTKVGRYDVDQFDFSAARVVASVDESLQRLGVDHVDLLLCHDIEFGSLDQIVDETLPALRRVCDAGKVRFLGFSGLPLAIYRPVLDRTTVDAILSYCHYTLFDTTLADLLPSVEPRGIGLINASPLAMGLLSDRGPQPWHPAPADVRAVCPQVATWCRARGVSLAQLALQFACAWPGAAVTLTGAASAAEVRQNVQACATPIDEVLLAEVQALLAPVRNRTWPSGRPENN